MHRQSNPLSYTWQTSRSTPAGSYVIRWNYPEAPGWDDYFTIYVSAPTPVPTPVPTPSPTLPPAQSIYSLSVNSPIDVSLASGAYRVYAITPSYSGEHKLFTGSYNGYGDSNDTVLELYSYSNLSGLIASNDDANGNTFSEIKTSLQAGMTYYVKLRHYSSSNAVYARLSVSYINTFTPINLNDAQGVSVANGETKYFSFTAPYNGNFKLSTASLGYSSDTYLELYSDPSYMKQRAYNDDANGTLFSEINFELNAWQTYYVKYRGYNFNSASSTLSVTGNYKYMPLYVSKIGDTPKLIDEYHAIQYTSGQVFVNLDGVPTTELNLGTDYVTEAGKVWLSKQLLEKSMTVTVNSTEVRLVVTDQKVIDYMNGASSSAGAHALANDRILPGECTASCDYTVILSAGMLTSTGFLEPLEQELVNRYSALGKKAHVSIQYPYRSADNLNILKQIGLGYLQLALISTDMEIVQTLLPGVPLPPINQLYGASKLYGIALSEIDKYGGKLILLGHSGGGVASHEAGKMLLLCASKKYSPSAIVQIGSPKTNMSMLANKVFFLRAYVPMSNGYESVLDPIPSIGTWGSGLPAQVQVVKLNPITKPLEVHMEYFNNNEWDRTDGSKTTNLKETANKFWSFVQ